MGAVAPQAWRARTPQSGTPHGCSPFRPPATAARASQQSPTAQPRGPTPRQRAVRKCCPYQPPLPGAREHNPLRTVRGSGLPHTLRASEPQLARRRRQNGFDGGARGRGQCAYAGAERELGQREPRGSPEGGAGPRVSSGAERPVAWEIRGASPAPPQPGSVLAAFAHFWEWVSCTILMQQIVPQLLSWRLLVDEVPFEVRTGNLEL